MIPDLPITEIEAHYTYRVPEGMNVARGDCVLVPFGGRTLVGYVDRVAEAEPCDFPFELRDVADRVEGLSLPENILGLLDFVEDEFAVTPGSALSAAIPPGIRNRLSVHYQLGVGEPVSEPQAAIVASIKKRGRLTDKALRESAGFSQATLKAVLSNGIVVKRVGLTAERRNEPASYAIRDERGAREFVTGKGKRRPAQVQCVGALLSAPGVALRRAEIAVVAGVSETTVKSLIDEGVLVETEPKQHAPAKVEARSLNAHQKAAVTRIAESIERGRKELFLLFGVTGSGKTEVYLHAVSEALRRGKRVLFLVPEIALTAQVLGQLRERFGPSVAVMHSGIPAGDRLRNWRAAAEGKSPIVVGARSAIFAPLSDIGLIIVDEEHDSSYKQDSSPRYDVRRLAEWRAKRSSATLVLGSATPSVETYFRAQNGELHILRLPNRAATTSLPEVFVEDLREAYRKGKPSILSPRLRDELTSAMSRGEQSMMFINRRAFARSLLCRDCGFGPKCPRCSVSLTFHSRPSHLRCHHCDYREPAPDVCPQCKSTRLRPLGLGTQKVEQFLKVEFPMARVDRLDRDVAARRGAVEETFGRVRSGQTQVLVGTQMIAKGLDFENVTLVGVISADMGLSIPDYRSTERTFQLLTQVSGRAGRRKPGRVVVQTFSPDYPAIRLAAQQDYEAFYESEIGERRDAQYPPFVRLVNVVISGPEREEVRELADRAKDFLDDRLDGSIAIYGPAECVLAKVRNRWRSHLLVKLPNHFQMSQFPRSREFEVERPNLVTVDVDPASLL